MLCWLYDCEFADGTPIDEGEIWQSVHDWLLPNRTTYDDETIIFKTGDGVTPEKIETLYWAMKEARAQFHRVSLNDIPLEESNPDDSLIAVIYNSPADYTYNNFLYGLGTNNGGIYIESWGTFFTYERTPQESIYTLEDLFRHEFSHYLQGRYMAPGMWGQDPIYDNERLSWFEEGGAEFLAGSSRLNGIQTRLTMVENIAQNEADRMTLAEVVNATYGNWEFYTYGFAFFDYMYKYRMDMLLEMVEFVKTGDGDSFDILMDEIANSDELNDLYQAHMDSLKANQNNFTDPVTSSLYFEEIENIPTEDIINEISSISQIQNISSETYLSSDHNLLSINGDITLETNNDSDSLWLAMNSNLNNVLASLDQINWNGYNTVNGWFSNPELNTNNQWVYRLDFQCKTSNDLFVTDDVSPKVFALHQNYPNPFNPITSFRYELPEKSHVTIEIYDMLGREVRTLVNTTQDAGFNSVIWNATNDYGKPVSTGVYLYQIQAGEFVQTRKMVLLK
jgi:microbial collagenase